MKPADDVHCRGPVFRFAAKRNTALTSKNPGEGIEAMNGHARDQVIRERAYHIWETHGRVGGKDLEHWLQAEREVSEVVAAPTTAAPKAAAPKAAPKSKAAVSAKAPSAKAVSAKPAAKAKKATKAAAKAPAKPRAKKKS